LLVIITVTDLSYMVIPDRILLFFAVVFLFLHLFFPTITWWDAISGAAVGFSSLLFIAIISRGGMGGGDIKLFAVIGLAIGVKSVLLSLFFATLYGAIVGILFIFIGVFEKGKPVPFGPFIASGTLTAFFFGDGILSWYFTLFY
jgi:leader peptidase (prepilin peptidase) / N-methyltransferase